MEEEFRIALTNLLKDMKYEFERATSRREREKGRQDSAPILSQTYSLRELSGLWPPEIGPGRERA